MNDKDAKAIASLDALYERLKSEALSKTDTDYRVGLPAPDDTPQDIATRKRMWGEIKRQIRAQETWMQWAKRIVKGLWR